ncbi:hypothetical protein DUNSADRAFT_5798 [Dunaliella salina]|nr:hypothetical protein DUNSADRAFT_5798 [Dunaliella salina]|eukprot:KAF5836562.1 hypothetical protein DUNSADRAFT_5798 [Dunaliella salina]
MEQQGDVRHASEKPEYYTFNTVNPEIGGPGTEDISSAPAAARPDLVKSPGAAMYELEGVFDPNAPEIRNNVVDAEIERLETARQRAGVTHVLGVNEPAHSTYQPAR